MKYLIAYKYKKKNGKTGDGRGIFTYDSEFSVDDIEPTEDHILDSDKNFEKVCVTGFFKLAEPPKVKENPDNIINPI